MTQIFASTTFLPGTSRVADAVSALADLGLDGLELGSTHLDWDFTPARLAGLRTGRLLTHNFFPPAADPHMVLNLAAPDPADRASSLAHCRHCLSVARDLGAELYTVHPGFLRSPSHPARARGESDYDFQFSADSVPQQDALGWMCESLSALLQDATGKGVTLAAETEGSGSKQGVLLMETPAEWQWLLALFPDLSVTLNLAHSALAARHHGFDLADFIQAVAPRVAAVELSHNDGTRDEHRPLVPGSWVLDWVPRLPQVPWILEFRDCSAADIAHARALILERLESASP